jgi:hypothetical protein
MQIILLENNDFYSLIKHETVYRSVRLKCITSNEWITQITTTTTTIIIIIIIIIIIVILYTLLCYDNLYKPKDCVVSPFIPRADNSYYGL